MPLPSLDCAYRPDLDVFIARWPGLNAAATVQDEYESLLHTPAALGTPHWLLDVRRRPVITLDSARWVTLDWLPRAAALLRPARLRLAFLVSPVRASLLHDDDALRAVMAAAYAPGHPFALRTFTDEGAAVAWLLGSVPD